MQANASNIENAQKVGEEASHMPPGTITATLLGKSGENAIFPENYFREAHRS